MPFSNKTQHMEGNPHYEDAMAELDKHIWSPEKAQVHATLALAFEQRTATLVAVRADSKHGLIKSLDAIQARILGGLNLR